MTLPIEILPNERGTIPLAWKAPFGRNLPECPSGRQQSSLRHYCHELLDYILSTDWENPGNSLREAGGTHPFREVFKAVDALKRHNDTLLSQLDAAAGRIEIQNRVAQLQEAHLGQLEERLLASREAERQHLAENLHDTACQTLGLGISRLKDVLEDATRHTGSLAEILGTLESALGEIRSTLSRIDPPLPQDTDLETAVRRLAGTLMQSHGITIVCRSRIQGNPVLGKAVRETLLRVVNELVANVAKHSGCTRAYVTMSHECGRVRVLVSDRGRGFNPSVVSPDGTGGLGLAYSRRRLTQYGGLLDIRSNAETGTRVCLTLPAVEVIPCVSSGDRLT
jgi:signal transduction histidine kinase